MLLQPFVCLVLSFAAAWCCPSQEQLAPSCECREVGGEFIMICSDIMSAEELIAPIRSAVTRRMFALTIQQSTLLYLPSSIFKGTTFEKIMFIKSQIMSLSDSNVAFEGLEDHLEEIRAVDAHYITQWELSQLRNLRRLRLLDIHDIAMHSLDQDFPPLKSLAFLGISNAEISFIHPKAFKALDNLKLLVLKNNDISEMRRSMLPYPAKELYSIELRDNRLASLPEDMFSGMPSLERLDLHGNRFVTLDEDTFQRPFEQLDTILLGGNSFRCDCRLRWMVEARKPFDLEGTCALPESMKGVQLKYLTNGALWC